MFQTCPIIRSLVVHIDMPRCLRLTLGMQSLMKIQCRERGGIVTAKSELLRSRLPTSESVAYCSNESSQR